MSHDHGAKLTIVTGRGHWYKTLYGVKNKTKQASDLTRIHYIKYVNTYTLSINHTYLTSFRVRSNIHTTFTYNFYSNKGILLHTKVISLPLF